MDFINDILITPLKIITHPKGNIYHALKKNEISYNSFGEAYFTSINHNEIKAWKKHNKMILNLICPYGKVKFVFYDDRSASTTKGHFQEIILSINDNYSRITIPPGIWMGFKGLSDQENIILNISNIEHDPVEQINISIDNSDFNYKW